MLEVKNIKYAYNSEYQALKGVSLKIEKGEMVALLGKNGAGKSTLFLHLNGIYEPDEGQVFIDGEELKYDKKSLLKFRQKVGIVFQNPDDQIFAPTVEEDVAFGPLNLGLSMEEVQDRVEEALARVGMSGFEKTAPHHLSGGQKKRVAIAGILAMKPEIMVLDEPTAGLDPQGVVNLQKLLRQLNDEGITIVISTHEVDLILSGHKHVPNIWKVNETLIVNAGSLCSNKLRGKNGNSYNVYSLTHLSIIKWMARKILFNPFYP